MDFNGGQRDHQHGKALSLLLLAPRIIAQEQLTIVYKDGLPVSPGHTVVIPKRHVVTLFEAYEEEQIAMLKALNQARCSSMQRNIRTARLSADAQVL